MMPINVVPRDCRAPLEEREKNTRKRAVGNKHKERLDAF